MAKNLLTLGVEPPGRDATELERLRFVRDLQVRTVPINVAGLVLIIIVGVSLWPVVAALLALLLLDIRRLTLRIRNKVSTAEPPRR